MDNSDSKPYKLKKARKMKNGDNKLDSGNVTITCIENNTIHKFVDYWLKIATKDK